MPMHKKSTAKPRRAMRGRALIPERKKTKKRARGAASGTREYTQNHKRYRVVGGKRVRVKSAKRQAAGRKNPYIRFANANRARIKAAHPNASFAQLGRLIGEAYRRQKGR